MSGATTRRAIDLTLAALSDPYQRAAVEVLREGPRPAGELAKALGLAPPAMSRRLKALRACGLVEESHPAFDARLRVYSLCPKPLGELIDWLVQTEAMWSGQLASFKDHVEAKGEA